MELRKFIATTLREYLNEQQVFETVDSGNLSFPTDFIKLQSRVQYLYQMGAMRPNGVNDTWYESKTVLTKKYRRIPIKFKIIKNVDGSDRGYKITQVGFDGDTIFIDNQTPQTGDVRKSIDDYYDKFSTLMSNVNVGDNELENLIKEKDITVSKNIYDGDLYETAIRWIINKRFNILEKRRILKYLINKGLSTEDAISFYQHIR